MAKKKTVKKIVSKEPQIENIFDFDNFDFQINPKFKLTTKQIDVLKVAQNPSTKMIILDGLPGSSKTFLSILIALEKLRDKKVRGITALRTTIQSKDGDTGYLPGPQPLDANIMTPHGWRKMGEIEVGDFVTAYDGTPVKVLSVFDKGVKDIYKITTDKGLVAEACEDHLWRTWSHNQWKHRYDTKKHEFGSIRSTKEIASSLTTNKGKLNHYLPKNGVVHFNKKESCPIPSYTMGFLLGDGSFSNNISFASQRGDEEIAERISKEISIMGCNVIFPKGDNISYNISSNFKNNKTARPIQGINIETGEKQIYRSLVYFMEDIGVSRNEAVCLCKQEKEFNGVKYKFLEKSDKWSNPIKEAIYNMGLLGCYAWEKFIPDCYKYGTVDERINLIRGLMDSDGHIKNNWCCLTTTSKRMADDVTEIIRSLGGKSTYSIRDRVGKESNLCDGRKIISRRVSYEVRISLPKELNPFFLKRKAKKFNPKFVFYDRIESVEYSRKSDARCILIDHPEHMYITNDFIVTHNTWAEKGEFLGNPFTQKMDELINKESKQTIQKHLFDFLPSSFIRSYSLQDECIILSEAQNAYFETIFLCATRVAEGSFIIIEGDTIMQNDIGGKTGFKKFCELYNDDESKKTRYSLF